MSTVKTNFSQVHPLVIFWLGVLTGAIAVGLIFFYRFISPIDYESAAIKAKPPYYQLNKNKATNNSFGNPQPSASFGNPQPTQPNPSFGNPQPTMPNGN